MEARKGNKVYKISEAEVDYYAQNGFTVYDGKKLVKHAVGASVSVEKYEELEKKYNALLAEVEKKQKKSSEKKED